MEAYITGMKPNKLQEMSPRSNEGKGGYFNWNPKNPKNKPRPVTREAKRIMEERGIYGEGNFTEMEFQAMELENLARNQQLDKMSIGMEPQSTNSSKSTAVLWLEEVGRLSILQLLTALTLPFLSLSALLSLGGADNLSVTPASVLGNTVMMTLSLGFVLSLKLLREREETESITNDAIVMAVYGWREVNWDLKMEIHDLKEKLASYESTTAKTKTTPKQSCDKRNTSPAGNCPYCDSEIGIVSSWGMSPEGWEDMKTRHESGHKKSL